MLTVLDEYSRECLAIVVARRLQSDDVLQTLSELFAEHGPPANLRSDNGSEFTAHSRQMPSSVSATRPELPTLAQAERIAAIGALSGRSRGFPIGMTWLSQSSSDVIEPQTSRLHGRSPGASVCHGSPYTMNDLQNHGKH